MRDNPGRNESDPTEDVRRHYKKNSPVLSCIRKRKKAVTVAAKSGQFKSGETGKGQFL